jgi:peptide/nickel transport system permease protein
MRLLVRTWRTGEGKAGLAVLLLLSAAALVAPILYPDDPLAIAGRPLIRPFESAAFPLGTDRLGRDVLAALLHGAQTSLTIGLAAAFVALALGAAVGTLAGFAGGLVDEALMRVTDAFQTVPGFLLALAFVSIVGPSLPVVVLAVALASWPGAARLARAEVLSVREREYVAAARMVGMHPLRVAFREIMPNVLPPVLTLSAIVVASAILTEAALSFLGLGDPNRVTWGGMIAEGRAVLRTAPYLSLIPGAALVVCVLGVHLTGEGLIEAMAGGRSRRRGTTP